MWPRVGDVWASPDGQDVYFVTRFQSDAWFGVLLTAEGEEENAELKFHYIEMGPIPKTWILVTRQA